MGATQMTTPIPLQITYLHAEANPYIDELIRKEAAKLERYYPRMVGCRVTAEHGSGRQAGNLWHIRVEISVPGGEIVVQSEPSLGGTARQTEKAAIRKSMEVRRERQMAHRAVRDAFKAARRQLQDYARKQRGETKRPTTAPVAKVTQVFDEQGYGFLITPEGREVYFHRESVLNGAFDELEPGTTVTYAEETGEKGPQASSVRLVNRQGSGVKRHTLAAKVMHQRKKAV